MLFILLSSSWIFEEKRDCSQRGRHQTSVINNYSKFPDLLLTGRLWHDDQLTLPGSNHLLIKTICLYKARDLCCCSCSPVISLLYACHKTLMPGSDDSLGRGRDKVSISSLRVIRTTRSHHIQKKMFFSIAFPIIQSRINLQSLVKCVIAWFDEKNFSFLIAQAQIY